MIPPFSLQRVILSLLWSCRFLSSLLSSLWSQKCEVLTFSLTLNFLSFFSFYLISFSLISFFSFFRSYLSFFSFFLFSSVWLSSHFFSFIFSFSHLFLLFSIVSFVNIFFTFFFSSFNISSLSSYLFLSLCLCFFRFFIFPSWHLFLLILRCQSCPYFLLYIFVQLYYSPSKQCCMTSYFPFHLSSFPFPSISHFISIRYISLPSFYNPEIHSHGERVISPGNTFNNSDGSNIPLSPHLAGQSRRLHMSPPFYPLLHVNPYTVWRCLTREKESRRKSYGLHLHSSRPAYT